MKQNKEYTHSHTRTHAPAHTPTHTSTHMHTHNRENKAQHTKKPLTIHKTPAPVLHARFIFTHSCLYFLWIPQRVFSSKKVNYSCHTGNFVQTLQPFDDQSSRFSQPNWWTQTDRPGGSWEHFFVVKHISQLTWTVTPSVCSSRYWDWPWCAQPTT